MNTKIPLIKSFCFLLPVLAMLMAGCGVSSRSYSGMLSVSEGFHLIDKGGKSWDFEEGSHPVTIKVLSGKVVLELENDGKKTFVFKTARYYRLRDIEEGFCVKGVESGQPVDFCGQIVSNYIEEVNRKVGIGCFDGDDARIVNDYVGFLEETASFEILSEEEHSSPLGTLEVYKQSDQHWRSHSDCGGDRTQGPAEDGFIGGDFGFSLHIKK